MSATTQSPLAVRDFRLLLIGEQVSTLGVQFALVALPWLALLLTGSGNRLAIDFPKSGVMGIRADEIGLGVGMLAFFWGDE